MESLPMDHGRSREEKLSSIKAYCQDPVLQEVGCNVKLTALDYRIIYTCMRHGWKGLVYDLSVLRVWLVKVLYTKDA